MSNILTFRQRLTLGELLALRIGRADGQRATDDIYNDGKFLVAVKCPVTTRFECSHQRPEIATFQLRYLRNEFERSDGPDRLALGSGRRNLLSV